MANTYRSTYDPGVDSGTSGNEDTDLTPASGYNVDLRYGDKEEEIYKKRADIPTVTPGSWPERPSYTNDGDVISQQRAEKFIKSAKAAGRFQVANDLNEYTLKGKTPRNASYTNVSSFGMPFGGLQTPSMGTSGGKSGGVGYADKPTSFAGKSFAWLDSFG
jgi:hypothetical protein